ncbi:hypothetical protein A140_08415 [Vibrio crassostreae 9ZC88]|nr:hypothetical protein A140_08415 [Vibrio crassostreae 9ZC88]
MLLDVALSWLVYEQNRYLRGDWYRFDSFGCADHSPVFYVDKVALGQEHLSATTLKRLCPIVCFDRLNKLFTKASFDLLFFMPRTLTI